MTFPLINPDNKVHGTNMGSIWGRQDPGGPNVDPMKFALWKVNISEANPIIDAIFQKKNTGMTIMAVSYNAYMNIL